MGRSEDDETESLRAERGKPPIDTPAERMADVPLAPHSAGALGVSARAEDGAASDADDRAAAEERLEKERG